MRHWASPRPAPYCKESEGPTPCDCHVFQRSKYENWLGRIAAEAPQRRRTVREAVERSGGAPRGFVSCFFTNSGMLYLWMNWALAAAANGIDAATGAVVLGDETVCAVAEAMGFVTLPARLYASEVLFGTRAQSGSSAADTFGKWPHSGWNGMAFVLLNDLVHLGYNVLLNDADTAWRVDPRPWLLRKQPFISCTKKVPGRPTKDPRDIRAGPPNKKEL